jgi:hypothetical protein
MWITAKHKTINPKIPEPSQPQIIINQNRD